MKHLQEAQAVKDNPYIQVSDTDHSVKMIIQDGPIKEVGENGCQAVDMLDFVTELFKSLNTAYPCRENALTITKLEEAIHWQDARTADREKRDVEGKSEK